MNDYSVGNALGDGIVVGTFKNHGAIEVVEAAGDSSLNDFVSKISGRVHAVLYVSLDAIYSLLSETVPQVKISLTITTSPNGGIDTIQVIDPGLHFLDVLHPGDVNSTGHGTT